MAEPSTSPNATNAPAPPEALGETDRMTYLLRLERLARLDAQLGLLTEQHRRLTDERRHAAAQLSAVSDRLAREYLITAGRDTFDAETGIITRSGGA
jgi:hypothetical protein